LSCTAHKKLRDCIHMSERKKKIKKEGTKERKKERRKDT
jgi:hypothetical protein